MTDALTRTILESLDRGTVAQCRLCALTSDQLRGLGQVTTMVTINRHTLLPEAGGLFDESLFGGRPAVIVLADPIRHPLIPEYTFDVLPVLPPTLRPIAQVDGEWVTSDINVLYQDVLRWNGRFTTLRKIELQRPIDEARAQLTRAVARLFDNERQPEPARDGAGRILVSLRGLLPLDAFRSPDPRVVAVCQALAIHVALD